MSSSTPPNPAPSPSPAPAIEPAGGGGGQPRFRALPMLLRVAGDYLGNAHGASALTTQAATSGSVDLVPICFPLDVQFDRLQIEVTGTAAEGGIKAAIFANADNKSVSPTGSALENFSDASVSAATTGLKTFTPSTGQYILRGGVLYWLALGFVSGSPTLRANALSDAIPISYPSAGGQANTILRGTGTLPTLPGTLTPTQGIAPYTCRFRVS